MTLLLPPVPLVLAIPATLFAILSAFSLLLMLLYLLATESKAPHISKEMPVHINERSSSTLVSIIVPARNEEDQISHCISSLLAQTYDRFEIIIVDDNSTDNTRAITREFESKDQRVRLISSGAKPEGWVGKSWPCWQGYQASKGDLLLFVDADSLFEPKAIEEAVYYSQGTSLDMFSISPKVVLKGIWSKATLPLVSGGINLLYPMRKVNDPKSDRAYVFGTFILARRSVYASIGGHEAVKDRIVEDAALARLTKSRGYKLRVMIGDGLLTTYWEHEFSSIYRGMERVFSDSIRSYGLVSLLDAVLIFFLGLYPILFIVSFLSYSSFFVKPLFFSPNLGAVILSMGFISSLFCVALGLAICTDQLNIVKGKSGGFLDPEALLYPIGFALFTAAIVTSTMKVSRAKGIEWKGQKFPQKVLYKRLTGSTGDFFRRLYSSEKDPQGKS